MNFEEILEFDTKLTADVTEWRPLDQNDQNHLLCGTYFLDKTKNQRLGLLYFLKIDSENRKSDILDSFEFNNSGILDLKWLNTDNIITIDSENILNMFRINENLIIEKTKELSLVEDEEKSIGLTIDFIKTNNEYKVLTSDTLGYLNLVTIGDEMKLENKFKAHDLETWSVLIDRNDMNNIYSGADDCTFKIWDLRDANRKVGECKIFEGGVTSIILPQRDNFTWLNGYNTNNILCGSYDEKIYVLDKRNLKRSLNESKKLNGGVWKIKLHKEKDLLLCACMHKGVHIVNSNSLESSLFYDGHGLDNLAYGCDWKRFDEKNDLVSTCSFYNHQLKIWKLKF
ncbi:unnamed protein product [Brachionus calyciflorus]|uniref:methylated diphthine methylhydrolase n=1 Tax=Brachionus calyciflorus TaxID=104777 RepID=A0A813M5C2_9BILA|nr:unnamed protein product [Brachionus calyciflorus]